MNEITFAQLLAFNLLAAQHLADILDACRRFDITTKIRQAMWLAQCAHESWGFSRSTENLNYDAAGLLKVFGRYFDAARAVHYAHNPQMIANRVYANRMGNGDEASGDGWKHRGQGWIEQTGAEIQTRYWREVHGDPLIDPSAIGRMPDAILSAAWFWQMRGCNEAADAGNFILETKLINGGENGLADREAWLVKARHALGA